MNSRKIILMAAAVGASVIVIGGVAGTLVDAASSRDQAISFEQQVMPILARNCVACHSPDGVGFKAIGLDLRSYRELMSGSTYGAIVVPHHPKLSPLVQVIEPDGHAFKNLKMPPVGNVLTPTQISTISTWIRQGAKDN